MPDSLTAAIHELAKASNRLADLHDRLWMALPPKTRAKMLGVSSRAERARRKKAQLKKLCESTP